MPVKIRLMRIGAKKHPFYRVVAVDERYKRTGGYLELLGTYNPISEPKEVKLDQKKIDEWVKKGAQMSEGFLRIIGKAPQHPSRPAKKQKKEAPSEVTPEVASIEEPKSEEVAKSSESQATGEVEQSEQDGKLEVSGAQQAGSEALETKVESTPSEPSGASTTDEPTSEESK